MAVFMSLLFKKKNNEAIISSTTYTAPRKRKGFKLKLRKKHLSCFFFFCNARTVAILQSLIQIFKTAAVIETTKKWTLLIPHHRRVSLFTYYACRSSLSLLLPHYLLFYVWLLQLLKYTCAALHCIRWRCNCINMKMVKRTPSRK